jgi:hypothetical protein
MPERNAWGIVTGFAFVVIFLAMLVTFGELSKVVQGPFATPPADGFELAGSSRPAN